MIFKEIEVTFENPEKYGIREYLIKYYFPKLSNNEILILSWMCKHLDEYGLVRMTIDDRKQIMKEYNLTSPTITRILNKLKEINAIQGERGFFKMSSILVINKETLKSSKLKITFEI